MVFWFQLGRFFFQALGRGGGILSALSVRAIAVEKGTLVRLIQFSDGRAAYAVISGSYTFTSGVE